MALLQAPPLKDPLSLLAVARDTIVSRSLYTRPELFAREVAPDGAAGLNAAFGTGVTGSFYIERQRYGADLIQAGVVRKDEGLIRRGWRMLDWGFARQNRDGGFAGTGDPFHSTSFFVEAAARALLLIKQGEPNAYSRYRSYLPGLKAAAHWLTNGEVVARYQRHNAPYTHRRWLLAAALGEVAELTNDAALGEAAAIYARNGIALQTPEGINPEKGGGDVSYQCTSVIMAGRYYLVCRDLRLRAQIQEMILRALKWELGRVSPSGDLNALGSTRVGQERGRDGAVKTVDFKLVVQAFSMGSYITGNRRFEECARRVAVAHRWL